MPIERRVHALVKLVEHGKMLDALSTFYADDVAMQENVNPPVVGLAANLERERAFFGSLATLQFRAASVLVSGDRAAINWVFDYTMSDGQRYHMDEIAVQTWRDGKVVHERFIYDTATLAVAA
jgi:ketosteroid isomerase-like protein